MSTTRGRANAEPTTTPAWGRRIAWLVGLWLAGVAVLGAIALLLRVVMRLAGLSS